ncbi:MAG: DUF547 domain-containing protein [Candidatus Cloacimonetes bacterium]|nr:DUF547 domain-containing protein [Candidatus Cloacimonadota bacterium]
MFFKIFISFLSCCHLWASGSMVKSKTLQIKVSSVSHRALQSVYDRFLKDGKVDYLGLKKNRKLLDSYLKKIAYLDGSQLERNDLLALYLNVYNAFTLQVIIDHYPFKVTNRSKPKESILQIPRVWDDYTIDISGELLSLNELEHQKIRKFQDPRVHFAMVCGANSCPKLQGQAFTKKNINSLLNKSRDEFLDNPQNYHYCKDCKTIRLSTIFKWFSQDFKKFYKKETRRYQKSSGVIGFIIDRMPKDLREHFLKKQPKIVYSNYDWHLNKQ